MTDAPVRVPGLVLTEHEIEVPLDHGHPDGEQITVFAREVAAVGGTDRPYLVFLQGGPGSEAPRPTTASTPAWLPRALRDFRVLMLDQRGTGRSTPVGSLLPAGTPAQRAGYLHHFRADAIVADAEALRRHLGVGRWSLLGQSFGGFCALHYLSVAPSSLREVFFTGGVPPVGRPVDEVYAATYDLMRARTRAYYRRFPADRERVAGLHRRADAGELLLPDGTPVTSRRLRAVGNRLGFGDGPAGLHFLFELDHRSPMFGHDLAAGLPFRARNPLYSVVHEASYADGGTTRWSAQRTMPDDFHDDVTLFTGEHLFEHTFVDEPGLEAYAEVAALLAEHEWPRLYDESVLSSVDVPCAAAVYVDDPYVPRSFSEETAELVPTLRTWVTDEYLHDGLRADERVLDRLIAMTRGAVQ